MAPFNFGDLNIPSQQQINTWTQQARQHALNIPKPAVVTSPGRTGPVTPELTTEPVPTPAQPLNPEQQQPNPLGGLLGQLQTSINRPLDFSSLGPAPSYQAVEALPDAQAIDPSQTFSIDPNSGQYFRAPGTEGWGDQINSLERATFQRGLANIDPYLQEQRQAMAQRLANQGLPIGSEAFNLEMDRFDRNRGNLLENLALSSVGAGRREHSRLFGMDMAGRQFDAGEAARQFRERLAGLGFNAAEQGRGFGERMGSQAQQYGINQQNRQFSAGQAAQQFASDMAARQQAIREMQMARQQPLSDLGQILGLAGQVGNPQFQSTAQYGPQNVDYLGYRAQQGNQLASLVGGLGTAAVFASDRRLKSGIKRLGRFAKGINWYSFVIDGARKVGFMSDEVRKVLPEAVKQRDGYDAVDYWAVMAHAR